jgi:adenylosuccinate synthase
MSDKVVIGIGFGDEGKGRVVDYLCSRHHIPLVVRFSGGHQAAHHVIAEGVDHVFSNFGSGTLRGVPTYWSRYCTVDPVGIMNELAILKEKKINPVLYVDEQCPVTTPYDKAINLKLDRASGHGSCGVGFGQTFQREEDRYSLLFSDLFSPTVFEIKMNMIGKYYSSLRLSLKYCNDFMSAVDGLTQSKNIISSRGFPTSVGRPYIFEGSQGLLLDQDIGFFPHVSRTNCDTKNILEMGFTPKINLVTRAYQTRHGNGPMTNEDIPHNIKVNPYEQNSSDNFQGEFRRTLLDLDLLKYAINKDVYIRSNTRTLFVTCLDLIESEYRLVIKGEIVNCLNEQEFIDEIKNHLRIWDIILSRSPTGAMEQRQGLVWGREE